MAKKLLRQNNLGQITNEFSILVTKELQKIADDAELKIKPIIRDELERVYKDNVRNSYTPISKTGIAVEEYNKTHKHQKPKSYHHTGTFADSVKSVIDGSTVKIIIEDKLYEDGVSTTQVHEWLTKGTTDTPRKKSYPYVKKQGDSYSAEWASYNPTPKHYFEEHTLEQMKGFLNDLSVNMDKYINLYKGRYSKKRRQI